MSRGSGCIFPEGGHSGKISTRTPAPLTNFLFTGRKSDSERGRKFDSRQKENPHGIVAEGENWSTQYSANRVVPLIRGNGSI